MTTDYRALCAELLSRLEESDDYILKEEGTIALADRARAALAQPEAVEPTDEELLGLDDLRNAWNAQADVFNGWDELGIDEIIWWAQRQARVRWGRSTPQPIPVSERLPEAGDCDAEGRCWWWHPSHPESGYQEGWMLRPRAWGIGHYDSDDCLVHTHWLPAHALPVPT